MTDQVIILKSNKQGLQVDTVLVTEHSDTLALAIDVSGTSVLEIPDKKISVETPGKDWFDYSLGIITIIGAIVTLIYTLKSIRKLFEKDEQRQEQIEELAAQTQQLIVQNALFERRIRMQVKPRIWSNGGGTRKGNMVHISLDNRGEFCYFESVEQIDGDKIEWNDWKQPVALTNEKPIRLTGTSVEKAAQKAEFRIKTLFSDLEGYKYEVVFHWKEGRPTLESSTEL